MKGHVYEKMEILVVEESTLLMVKVREQTCRVSLAIVRKIPRENMLSLPNTKLQYLAKKYKSASALIQKQRASLNLHQKAAY